MCTPEQHTARPVKKALGDTKRDSGLFFFESRNYFTVKSSMWVCFPSESMINVYSVRTKYIDYPGMFYMLKHSQKNYINSRVNITYKFHILF